MNYLEKMRVMKEHVYVRGDHVVEVLGNPDLTEVLVGRVRAKEPDGLQDRREVRIVKVERHSRAGVHKPLQEPQIPFQHPSEPFGWLLDDVRAKSVHKLALADFRRDIGTEVLADVLQLDSWETFESLEYGAALLIHKMKEGTGIYLFNGKWSIGESNS